MRRWQPEYIPAYLSNGVIGMRSGPIPQLEGVAIVNGLASIHADEGVEGFARSPYPVAGDIIVNGCSLKQLPARATLVEQVHDFACGELRTTFRFEGRDANIGVQVLTYCSRTQPTVVVQQTEVTTDAPCRLSLSAGISHEGVPGGWLTRETRLPGSGNPLVDGCLRWEPPGALSSCGAAYHTEMEGAPEPKREVEDRKRLAPLMTTYSFEAITGRKYTLRQLTSLVASQLNDQPHRAATRLTSSAALVGFDRLRRENRAAWERIWEGRVCLLGAGDRWQGIADASFYYLQSSAHAASLFSTSMFGLAYWPNYHYYRGQVMWDIETFGFPPLLLTDPAASAALLDFRRRGHDMAEMNAALNGYEGIQFPWAASPLNGQEALRTDAPLISREEHVNMSVGHAFAQYWYATGDTDFARRVAWPAVRGIALWIESRGIRTRRGLEILQTLGPAETREALVDNDAYVNMAAAVVLREAASLARLVGADSEAARWERTSEALFIPVDDTLGIVLNHEHFTPAEEGVAGATPETLGALFPIGYQLNLEMERRTIDFYLGRVEPYLGHPMLSAPLGVLAARNGDRGLSRRLFEAGFAEFINEPWKDANEFSRTRFPDKPVVGPLFANIGGFLTSCMFGLPAMRPGPGAPDTWFERPVVMPEGWDGIEIDRLTVRGGAVRLVARHGMERGRFEPASPR